MGRLIDRAALQDWITTNKVTSMDPMPASFMGAGEEYAIQDGTTFKVQGSDEMLLVDERMGGHQVHVI